MDPSLILDDEELAARAADNFDAFAELYRRHLCRIFRFMRSKTPDEAVAEDLTAQVFFRALSSARTYRGDGSYQAWLFQIAYNVLSTWRGRSDRLVVGIDQIPERIDLAPSPPAHAIQKEVGHLLWCTVDRLPPAQREVIRLRYLYDLTTEEIGRATKRSQGAVRVLLHRARTRLRHIVEGKDLS
ncbi:MAG: sigma-70 family RNA polymerase sigma factor [Actinobacteria bacterium]|nr:sigma-70 family RNA polymerase sigma factor [Actinomycetota bacterium]